MTLTLSCAQHVCAHIVVRLLHGQEGAAEGGCDGGGALSTLPREPPVEEVRKAAAWCEATHELCGVQTKRLVLSFLVPCGSGSDQKCVLILFLASLFVVSKKKKKE